VTWSNEHTINLSSGTNECSNTNYTFEIPSWNHWAQGKKIIEKARGDKKGKKNGTGSKKIKMEIKYLFG
jgi:hypothetical protein